MAASAIPLEHVGFDTEFDRMKVAELKVYLKLHGQLMSGNKAELIRRAKGTAQLFLRKASQSQAETKSTQQTITVAGECTETSESVLSENQLVEKLTDWVDIDAVSSDSWPDFTDREVYNYLVYSCQKTVDLRERKARRQLKAHTFYEDRHVHAIRHHLSPESGHETECYIRCSVIPSAASSDKKVYPDHRVWLRMSQMTGQVNAAYCTCTAGIEGSCNHVAALMYALVGVTEHKKGGLDASTSKPCKWNQPRKRRLSPQKAAVLATKTVKLTCGDTPKINEQKFAARLKVCAPNAGWLVNVSASTDAQLPDDNILRVDSIPTPMFMYSDLTDLQSDTCKTEFTAFRDGLKCSQEEVWQTESATKDQLNSDLWFKARAGRLTSSHFGDVVRRQSSIPPDNLVKKLLNYSAPFNNSHTKWGVSHEPAARRMYAKEMKKKHQPIRVTRSGLIINSKLPFLASSPDGLVNCSHCRPSNGILEIKCPSVHRNKTPSTACSDPKFFCQLRDGIVSLKRNHNYYYQVQGQIAISDSKWCDFVVWTLKGMTIERIYFDEKCWQNMVEKLCAFYVDAMLPEMFTERIKRGKSLF